MTKTLTKGAITLLCVLAAACGDDDSGSTEVDAGPEIDAQMSRRDLAMPTDMPVVTLECTAETMGSTVGESCFADSECQDGCFCNGTERCMGNVCVVGTDPCTTSECSTGSCDEAADACELVPDDTLCDDGVFCNGPERCDGRRGCLPGIPPLCTDGDICTIDRCDEATAACVNSAIDEDGDGAIARSCGGEDCDDRNADRAPGLPEICGNGIDDDCNSAVDALDTACAPTNDLCADAARGPLDITPVGLGTTVISSSTVGMAADYDTGCGETAEDDSPDAVFTFTLDQTRRVGISMVGAGSSGVIVLAALADCGDEDEELACSDPSSSTQDPFIGLNTVPAGTYAIIVKTEVSPAFDLSLTIAETQPLDLTGDTCANPIDVSAGGTFTGNFLGDPLYSGDEFNDDFDLACFSSTLNYVETVFTFTTTEVQDVTLRGTLIATSGSEYNSALALADDCESPSEFFEERYCIRESVNTSRAPATLFYRNMPAGTYFVHLEKPTTSTTNYNDWRLEVQIDPASGSNPGDDCSPGTPLDITSSQQTVDLSTLLEERAAGEFCRVNTTGYIDLFYQFTLASTVDVTVNTDGGGVQHWAAVSETCGSPVSEYECYGATSGSGSRTYRRLGPGTYFVNVSTFATSGNITASITTAPATPAPANDTCAGAELIASGSVDTFDLTSYSDSEEYCAAGYLDAHYRIVLTQRSEVTLRADGARRIALFDDCALASAPTCSSSAVFPPRLETILDPGTYYVAVEGDPFSASSSARFIYSAIPAL